MSFSDRLKEFIFRPTTMAIICLVTGAISAFAMAPTSSFPALILGLSTLYLFLQKTQSSLLSFILGLAFGFGYFTFSLYWIGNALLVEGNPYSWAWPLAVTGLPFILSFFIAIPCLLSTKITKKFSVTGLLSFTALLSIFEILRGYIFTGFPWNLFGYTWVNVLEIAQFASLFSIYGLSTLTIFWAVVPGFMLLKPINRSSKMIVLVLALTSFGVTYFYGAMRIKTDPQNHHDNTYVQIVQPNIAQADKWKPNLLWDHFQTHIKLSQPKAPYSPEQTTIIVWPETAISFHILNNAYAMAEIANMLASHPGKAYLVTGLMDYNDTNKSYANMLVMIDSSGKVSNFYKKHHLVPFGEYIPFQEWIPIPTITQFNGLDRGSGPQTFPINESLSYGAAICYEIIFPGAQTIMENQADMIINVTNDAWYDISPGPYQHFVSAQFRAIEEGLPVIRSANTGFSGLIHPFGHVKGRSELFLSYSEKFLLPKGVNKSIYSFNLKIGIWLGFLITLITIGYIQKRLVLK